MIWIWVGMWVLWGFYGLWQEYRFWKLRQHVQRIVQVLSAAGPELNRRIVEGENGTSVRFRDQWRDIIDVEEEGR